MLTIIPLWLLSCGNDADNNDNSALQQSYQKTKANIIGTWILEAQYHSSNNPEDLGGIYNIIGWDNNDEYGAFQYNYCYKFIFKSDGTFTNKDNEVYNYSIELNENKDVFFTSEQNSEYWPFKKGTIVLKFDDNFYKKKYIKEFLVVIKNDGMLYLYYPDANGRPKYRYRKQ